MDSLDFTKRIASLCFTLVLIGCANPYALNVNKLNYNAEQKSGVIQFTDPKLFPREHLIDERREEITFLESELTKCNNIQSITPSIIRELEVVRSLAAGVGLSIDPAKATDFNVSKDIAALKNDIAQTSLEMQLQQLKRDAQLLKDQLDKQQTVANAQTPAIPGSVTTVSSNGATAPTKAEIETLLAKADAILDKLQADARANIGALTAKGGTADPIDTFNYRRACRDTVKSAINKTRLDSLHDFDGNALVRLQLQATVLPPGDEKYNDTLGILRMEVIKPFFDAPDGQLAAKVYRNWLEYVNRNINVLPQSPVQSLEDQRIRTSPRYLAFSDYFDLAYLELPKRNSAGDDISGAGYCSGLQQTEKKTSACWYLRVALPKGSAAGLDVQLQAAPNLIDQLRGAADGIRLAKKERVTLNADATGKQCSIDMLDAGIQFKRISEPDKPGKTASEAVHLAYQVKNLSSTVAALSGLLQEIDRQSVGAEILRQVQDFPYNALLLDAADEVLAALMERNPQCTIVESNYPVPKTFVKAIKQSTQRVAVYEVAPTERVQAVSTAARAADAVALAASIAGTLPTYGLGASGNFAFSRSAVGKADALELAPIVVGFAEPGSSINGEGRMSSFGWLLGPKAVLDPEEQKMKLIHSLKPYDLYADLSIPGWWPEFDLKTYSAWAPNWRDRNGAGRTLDIVQQRTLERTLKVSMRNNFSDMEGLTTMLLRASHQPVLDAPRIAQVEPRKVSPCDGDIDFQIWGDNIWRANMVILGGKLLDGHYSNGTGSATNAIRLLPDMHGIVASLNVRDIPLRRGSGKKHEVNLDVWTPDGHDFTMIEFDEEQLQKDGTCSPKNAGAPKKADAPKITAIRPATVSACDGKLSFQIMGENLTADSVITVGGIAVTPVKALPSKAGLTFDLDPGKIRKIGAAHEAIVRLSNAGGDASANLTYSALKNKDGKCIDVSAPNIVSVIPNKLSLCGGEISITVTGSNLFTPQEATLGTVKATSVQELSPNDGTVVNLTVDMKTSSAAFKGLADATISVRTKNGIAKTNVMLAPGKCQ